MMNYGSADSVPMCNPTPKQPTMKETMQDTNQCLRECVLSLVDFRNGLCGRGEAKPEPMQDPQCLTEEVSASNGLSHMLLEIIREIQAVVM